MKVIIAGGNGFIGRLLAPRLGKAGGKVLVLTRRKEERLPVEQVIWDGKSLGPWARELEGSDLLLNLAGRSVNCRYTSWNRAEIYASRLDSTRVLGEAIAACRRPPRLWINSSTATIYRHAEDREMDEATGESGAGFSVDVATQWERTLFNAAAPATRKVALRAAMVFGPGRGGVYQAFRNLVRLGLGGTIGPGTQYMSWLHHEDLARIVEWLWEHPEIDGALNASAPHPLANREFMAIMRAALGQCIGLPSQRWMLEIGAFFLRTETELLLKSRRVVPRRLLESGFRFRYPEFSEAVAEISDQGSGNRLVKAVTV